MFFAASNEGELLECRAKRFKRAEEPSKELGGGLKVDEGKGVQMAKEVQINEGDE